MFSALLVYTNKVGAVKVLTCDEALTFDKAGWTHVASIEPKAYLQGVLEKNPHLVAEFTAKL